MYYEINVSKDGHHYFATAERSIRDEQKLVDVMAKLILAFPEEQGYRVSATRWETVGQPIELKKV